MKFTNIFLIIVLLFVVLGCKSLFAPKSKPLVADEVLTERFRNQKADFDRLAKILQTTNWQNNSTLINEMDEIEKRIGASSTSLHAPENWRLDVFVVLPAELVKEGESCSDFYAYKGYAFSRETAAVLAERGQKTYDGKTKFRPLGENWYIYHRPNVAQHSTERCGKE